MSAVRECYYFPIGGIKVVFLNILSENISTLSENILSHLTP